MNRASLRSKKTVEISIFIEDLSRNSAFFWDRSEALDMKLNYFKKEAPTYEEGMAPWRSVAFLVGGEGIVGEEGGPDERAAEELNTQWHGLISES